MDVRATILQAIDDEIPVEDFVAGLGLEPCAGCGEPVSLQESGDAELDARCDPCRLKLVEFRRSSLPKAQALERCGVPQTYRRVVDWLSEPWACDPTWPDREVARDWLASDAWSLTLAGVLGSGKSMMAAEILLACWRSGARPAKVPGSELPLPMWVAETSLAREHEITGFGEPRHLAMACRYAPVLVWDELGATWSTTKSRQMTMDLIGARYSDRRPTIFTTHRPVSCAKAKALEIDEGQSIEIAAPEIYSRLLEGAIGRWMPKSWRGTGDEVPA